MEVNKFLLIFLLLIIIPSAYAINWNIMNDWVPISGGEFTGNVTAPLYFGLFDWFITPGLSQKYMEFNNSHLFFNETQLNVSIDARTASTTYNATSIATIEGTLDDGDLASVQSIDKNWYNVSENAGGSPLLIEINFTGVEKFSDILLRTEYVGGLGHEIEIQSWNYDDLIWETHHPGITDQSSMVELVVDILDASDHVSGGLVQLRIDHIQNGNPAHEFRLDFIALQEGFTSITNADHDGLLGRDNKENHPWAMPTDASRNFTADVYTNGTFYGRWNGSSLYTIGPHTTDTNETTRMNNIASFTCTSTDKVSSFGADGLPVCTSDAQGGGGVSALWDVLGDYIYINTSRTGGIDDINVTGDAIIEGTVGNSTHSYTWEELNNTGTDTNTNCSVTNSCNNIIYSNNVSWKVDNATFADDSALLGGQLPQQYNDSEINTTENIEGLGFATGDHTNISNGTGLFLDGGLINHTDTSTQESVDNSGTEVIQDIILDTFGHITSLVSTDLGSHTSADNASWNVTTARNIFSLLTWNKTYADTLYTNNTGDNASWNQTTAMNLFALLTWNKTYADSLYAVIAYGDEWNKTYADSLYSPINYGDDWNKTYADTLYSTGAHTTDTNASTICSDGEYLDGDGTCITFNATVRLLSLNKTEADALYLPHDINETNINITELTAKKANITGNLTVNDCILFANGGRICQT